MSILTENSRKMLVESMRSYVKDVLQESTSLTASEATQKSKFISESATYEQLLNITMNPLRESKYLPDYVLEGAVAILHSACMTGRKNIGPNAITEGALKLHKKTGAVITESMLDAALTAVNEGCGLKIVGKILTEASVTPEIQAAYQALANYQANLSKSGVAINIVDLETKIRAAGFNNPTEIINQVKNGNPVKNVLANARTTAMIDGLKAQLKHGGLTTVQRDAINGRLARLQKNAERHALKLNGGSLQQAAEKIANAPTSGTPWKKIALGAAAAGAAGLGAYKYWQNKKAMEADRQNGTQTF